MRARTTPLGELLAARIQRHGPITFADYMEACLYHPQHGYYSKSQRRPRRDYFTSVDVSAIFGRLLARQFEEMWTQIDRPEPFLLIEAGAGDGALAKDILDSIAQSSSEFYLAVRYVAVERAEARCRKHGKLLEEHAASGKFESSAEMPEQIPVGCVFSNELVDALPVH